MPQPFLTWLFGGLQSPFYPAVAQPSFPPASTTSDNFDDNSVDPKWTSGVFYPPSYLTTGTTNAEINQRTELKLPASTATRTIGRISVGLFDLTSDALYVKISNAAALQTGEVAWLAFGTDGNNCVLLQAFGGTQQVTLEEWVGGTRVINASAVAFGTDVWFRLRHVQGNTLKIDTAPSSASNPPVEGDWVNRISQARSATSNIPLHGGKAAFGVRANGTSPASPITVQFDGFNTATVFPTVSGTATGSIALTGSAAATVKVQGASSGSLPLTGSSAALVKVQGASSGTLPFTGAAAAKVKVQASASGTLPLTGSDLGRVKAQGAAASALPLTGAGTAKVKVQGASSGSLPLTGSSTAKVKVRASASGALSLTGTASSSAAVHAGGAGSLPLTGSALAKALIRASANDNLALAGSALGTVTGSIGATGSPPVSRTGRVGGRTNIARVEDPARIGKVTRSGRIG